MFFDKKGAALVCAAVMLAACSGEQAFELASLFEIELEIEEEAQELARISAVSAGITAEQLSRAAALAAPESAAVGAPGDTDDCVQESESGSNPLVVVSIFDACNGYSGQIKTELETSSNGLDLALDFTNYQSPDVSIQGPMVATISITPSKVILNTSEQLTFFSGLLPEQGLKSSSTWGYTYNANDNTLTIVGTGTFSVDQSTVSLSLSEIVYDPANCPRGPSSGEMRVVDLSQNQSFKLIILGCGEGQVVREDGGTETWTATQLDEFFADIVINLEAFTIEADEAKPVLEEIDESDDAAFFDEAVTADTVPPDSFFVTAPTGFTNDTDFVIHFASDDPDATFECALGTGDYEACESPLTYTALEDAVYTLALRGTDEKGNVEQSPALADWTVDTIAPVVSVVGLPAVTSDVNLQAQIAADEPASFACGLDTLVLVDCVSPVDLNALSTGNHTLNVQATDLAGNSAAIEMVDFEIDADLPVATVVAGPDPVVNETSAEIQLSANEAASYRCRLDGGAYAPCNNPATFFGLADGPHTVDVLAVDLVGNVSAAATSHTWSVDTTSPETLISQGPLPDTSATTIEVAFNSPDGASFECSLDGAPFAGCVSPVTHAALVDGTYMFEVRAIDGAGNPDFSPALTAWTVDTIDPETSLDSAPPAVTADTFAGFGFSSTETVTFQCRVDGGSWESCSSPESVVGLLGGPHLFEVRSIDPAGNVDATPASHNWTIDVTSPDTLITSGPPEKTTDAAVTVHFTANETGTTFQCNTDSAGWVGCNSPVTTAALSEGPHTMLVRAIDAVGNVDAIPAVTSWTLDSTPPQTSLDFGPPDFTTNSTANFFFSAGEPGTFECNVDGGGYAPCSSPLEVTGIGDGGHTFLVRAIDTAGNVDATPAQDTWTVDNSAPDSTIDVYPDDPTSDLVANFEFSAPETAAFECRLDNGIWAACASPTFLFGLTGGLHTFDVRAIDTAGNVESSFATTSWTVDVTAPETTIDSAPAAITGSDMAVFSFSAGEPAQRFRCALDGGPWLDCNSPVTYTSLAATHHTFAVFAFDLAGNMEMDPAEHSWTVDLTAPETNIDAGPDPLWFNTAVTFEFSANEPATFECQLDGGGFSPCSSPQDYFGLADTEHTFEVRAIDVGGTTDPTPASLTFLIDTSSAPVSPLYAVGVSWSAYVTADGSGVTDASGLDCDSNLVQYYSGCLHAAEILWVPALGESSCDNLTAEDARNWFDWTCDDSTQPVRFIAAGLPVRTLVADLINWSTYSWYPNMVTVYQAGVTEVFTSQQTVWWTNPISATPPDGVVDQDWMVYAFDTDPGANVVISDVDHVSLIVKPGFAIDGNALTTRLIYANDTGSTRDFLWFEGRFNATARTYGFEIEGSRHVRFRHVEVSGATNYNVYGYSSPRNWLMDYSRSSGADSNGGFVVDNMAYGTFQHLYFEGIDDSTSTGALRISGSNAAAPVIRHVTAVDGGVGIDCEVCPDLFMEHILVTGMSGRGVEVNDSDRAYVRYVTSHDNNWENFYALDSDDGFYTEIDAPNNVDGGNRTSVFFSDGARNMISNIIAGNSEEGFKLDSGSNTRDNVIINLTSFNSKYKGIWVSNGSTDGNVFINTTLVHNQNDGILADDGNSFNLFMNLLAANNVDLGFGLDDSDRTKVINLAAAHNGEGGSNDAGIQIEGADETVFKGLIVVGNNNGGNSDGGIPDCYVGGVTLNPGISQDCTPRDDSDFILVTDATLEFSFVGKVTTDSVNPTPLTGPGFTAEYDKILNWTDFETPWRGWGSDGNDFPSTTNRDRCRTGDPYCALWDFGLRLTDTVVRDVLPVPTGDVTYTTEHQWSASSQGDCDLIDGAVWSSPNCRSTMLHNAYELLEDGLGNDNGLCESNEDCVYTPNIGAYQGHGALIPLTAIGSGGTIENVNLFQYSQNGY